MSSEAGGWCGIGGCKTALRAEVDSFPLVGSYVPTDWKEAEREGAPDVQGSPCL